MTTLITAAQLLTDNGLIADPILVLENTVITTLTTRAASDLPQATIHHHYPGATLAPAFLDVHTHGCCGRDVMEATPDALDTVNRFLAQHGVGAYLPTTITAPHDVTLRSLAGLAKLLARPAKPGQAHPLGIHLEGPFLSHAKRGAHPTRDLLEPSIPFFEAMWQAAEGRITLMTLAPELPGAIDLIAHAVARGVQVSIGHSDGSAEDAQAAITAGAVSATHTFNAMRRLDHREPGILGAVLTTDTLYAELICDGLHTDPSMVQLFARAKPSHRAILITDAMSAAGMPDGTYKLGELDVRVTAGRAITGENTLAGSTLTLDTAIRNYRQFAQISLAEALHAATRNPARMARLDATVGILAEGRPANLNVLSPSGQILATYLAGVPVERSPLANS
jgi:N-acetylglucosamine-6-phosphate deacetylase